MDRCISSPEMVRSQYENRRELPSSFRLRRRLQVPNDPGPSLPLIQQAAQTTVGSLFAVRASLIPNQIAVQQDDLCLTYAELDHRVNQTADVLRALGVGHGDRVAILSENRTEYLELLFACAKLGAILACQNWRQAPPELAHCVGLVEPKVIVTSPRHSGLLDAIDLDGYRLMFGDDYESRLAGADVSPQAIATEPEDILLILYTSGTTGLPKGAMLSHRAEIARAMLSGVDYATSPTDTSVAWAPYYHMAAMEPSIRTLLVGGKVIIVDGFNPRQIADVVAREELGWLLLMPGMVEPLIDELKLRQIVPRGVKLCGAMADLVPAHQIAEITRLLDAPYVNTFGATETGGCPCSKGVIPVGHVPTTLSKTQSSFCEIKLVDADDNEVADGIPGELAIRGPTVFSGYWQAEETNVCDFRGGYFHMGDMFVRNPNRTLDFVDRVKYLIKSGGENIYPAEIERVLLADHRVADAIVVRRKDDKWGEVPVAVVARKDDSLTEAELQSACRRELAGYKQPKAFQFVALDELPRSTTGKIQRDKVEQWVANEPVRSD